MYPSPKRRALRWLEKWPSETRDYCVPLACALAAGDQVITAYAACAPSGAGELAVDAVSVSATAITVQLSGGQPNRLYRVRVLAPTAAGLEPEWIAEVPVKGELPGDTPGAAASLGFGAPAVWNAAMPLALNLANRLSCGLVGLRG